MKEGALYLSPTSLEFSFSLPSTANPDRGLGLYPPSRKGDPHEGAESNRAPKDNKATLNQWHTKARSSTSEYSKQRPEFLSLDGPGFREGCRGEVEVGTIGKFLDYPWKWGCIDVRRFGFASKNSFDWTKATSRNKEREARFMLAARFFYILTNRSNAMFRSFCAWRLAKNSIWFSRCHSISGIFALDESRCTPVKPSK